MNARRKEILKELGLTPLWHIKSNKQKKHTTPQAHTETQNQHNPSLTTTDETRHTKIQRMNWNVLKDSVTHCTACPLAQTRSQTVFGVGDENANWMCVGEGPGAREDEIGEPFVGPAGKLLDNMLAAINLSRSHQVYISNIVKCRPPNNRNPNPSESHQCSPFLARQIELVRPKLIIALGKVAAQNLLKCDDSISSLRGRLHQYSGIPLIVTYHPAYLLRALPEKEKVWEDLCFAKATMQSLYKA